MESEKNKEKIDVIKKSKTLKESNKKPLVIPDTVSKKRKKELKKIEDESDNIKKRIRSKSSVKKEQTINYDTKFIKNFELTDNEGSTFKKEKYVDDFTDDEVLYPSMAEIKESKPNEEIKLDDTKQNDDYFEYNYTENDKNRLFKIIFIILGLFLLCLILYLILGKAKDNNLNPSNTTNTSIYTKEDNRYTGIPINQSYENVLNESGYSKESNSLAEGYTSYYKEIPNEGYANFFINDEDDVIYNIIYSNERTLDDELELLSNIVNHIKVKEFKTNIFNTIEEARQDGTASYEYTNLSSSLLITTNDEGYISITIYIDYQSENENSNCNVNSDYKIDAFDYYFSNDSELISNKLDYDISNLKDLLNELIIESNTNKSNESISIIANNKNVDINVSYINDNYVNVVYKITDEADNSFESFDFKVSSSNIDRSVPLVLDAMNANGLDIKNSESNIKEIVTSSINEQAVKEFTITDKNATVSVIPMEGNMIDIGVIRPLDNQ